MASHMVKTQIIRGEAIVSGPPGLLASHSSLSEGLISPEVTSPTAKLNSELQTWFAESISKSMKIPDRYQNVTVQVISWCKDLDDLKCEDEVQQLAKLFSEEFRFQVEHTKLDNNKPPQQQLNHTIHKFVYDHDGEYNLLLVYYAGHGSFSEINNQLIFSASLDPNSPQAIWGPVEQTLMDNVEGDVLVILDCCFASNVQRGLNAGIKTYELLAASNRDNTTPRPGPGSFTSDLMKTLRELLKDHGGSPFTTNDLLTKLTLKRPKGLEPALHNRRWRVDSGLRGRHICLAPHNPQDKGRAEGFAHHNTEVSNLTLAFELDQRSLDREQVDRLAKRLPKVFKQAKIPLRGVHFKGLDPRFSLLHKIQAITKMKRSLARVRRRRCQLEAVHMMAQLDANHMLGVEIEDHEVISDEDSKLAIIESPCPNQAATAPGKRHSQRLLVKKCSV